MPDGHPLLFWLKCLIIWTLEKASAFSKVLRLYTLRQAQTRRKTGSNLLHIRTISLFWYLHNSCRAHSRIEADVRITDFRLASTNNATSSYEEFGKNHINSNITLNNSSSTITYYVEITNYGTTDVGIYSITGLPSGVNYQIKDYNLKDKNLFSMFLIISISTYYV